MQNNEINKKFIVTVDESIKTLIPNFLNNRRKDVDAISAALDKHDYPALELLGHKLKGTAGNYGFTELSEIGKNIEELSKIKDNYKIRILIDQFLYYIENVEIIYG